MARTRFNIILGALALAVLMIVAIFSPVDAAGARRGVKATGGEFVLVRNVPARYAIRKQSPGMAVLIDAGVSREVNAALGSHELSDSEFSALATGIPTRNLGDSLLGALGNAGLLNRQTLSGVSRNGGAKGGPGGVTGAVRGATRGISSTISGALQGAGLLNKGG